jgi:hypothetical protein
LDSSHKNTSLSKPAIRAAIPLDKPTSSCAVATRSVDLALVMRNWRYSWRWVTFERAAAGRAELHGKNSLHKFHASLLTTVSKAFPSTNFRLCRSFDLSYQKIHLTLSAESLPSEQIDAVWHQLSLGRSHYVLR